MVEFKCGSLVPGCPWQARGEEADVIARAAEHLRTAHGETELRPTLIERIRERLEPVEQEEEARRA